MDKLFLACVFAIARPRLVIGVTLMIIGVAVLVVLGAWFAMTAYGESQFDDLTVPQSDTGLTMADLTRDVGTGAVATPPDTDPLLSTASTAPNAGGDTLTTPPVNRAGPPAATAVPPATSSANQADSADEDNTPLVGAISQERPGEGWDFRPLRTTASTSAGGSTLGAAFSLVDWDALPHTIGENPTPTRIEIPAIGLDSRIVNLAIDWSDGEPEWQTADHAVGFHVGSASPGEIGNSVLSGHVNSPFRGEGAVFARLTQVAPLLREGRVVDIILETDGVRYLYRATGTDVRLPEDVNVFRVNTIPTLSLVTCTPSNAYTHRFIVDAVLIGEAPIT